MPHPRADRHLVQIVDAALADAARRSGDWLVCRPGCTQCCIGVFAINQLDASRLRKGMQKLEREDPRRAARVRRRAGASLNRLAADFPGDLSTGLLHEDEEAEAAFEELGNDEPCPALDPATGLCDLYSARPMTCRVFGPPVRFEGGLGVCELCYHGATDAQIVACEMHPDPGDLESSLVREVEKKTKLRGRTIVACCLAR